MREIGATDLGLADVGAADPVIRCEATGVGRVLQELSLAVPAGAVMLLVGRNGAGKSTLLRVLLGLERPDAGRVRVLGRAPSHASVRVAIGWCPETSHHVHAWLRVRDLLRYHAHYFPTWDTAYQEDLLAALAVDPSRRFDRLSKGERRRVQLVMALAHRPRLLLLDEPLDGLDPPGVDQMLAVIGRHLAIGVTTMLWVTHHVAEVDPMADHLAVLDQGRITQFSREEIEDRVVSVRVLPGEGTLPSGLSVLREERRGREGRVLVRGDAEEVIPAFARSGWRVLECRPATLPEVARALLPAQAA